MEICEMTDEELGEAAAIEVLGFQKLSYPARPSLQKPTEHGVQCLWDPLNVDSWRDGIWIQKHLLSLGYRFFANQDVPEDHEPAYVVGFYNHALKKDAREFDESLVRAIFKAAIAVVRCTPAEYQEIVDLFEHG